MKMTSGRTIVLDTEATTRDEHCKLWTHEVRLQLRDYGDGMGWVLIVDGTPGQWSVDMLLGCVPMYARGGPAFPAVVSIDAGQHWDWIDPVPVLAEIIRRATRGELGLDR